MYAQTSRSLAGFANLYSSSAVVKEDVTIVIPVKNEEQAISAVIDEVTQEGFANILVVDGYSVDRTLQIVKQKPTVTVIQQHGRGKTGAIKTAIENVTTPYLLVLDGDYTYQAHDIHRFLTHCPNYAQVIGVRDRKNISLLHRFGNWALTRSFNLLMGCHLSDICSGMYLLKTDVAKNIELSSRNFATEVEIAAQTISEHEVTEVPIGYRRRLGKAKLSWASGFGILSAVVVLARKYNPALLFSVFSFLSVVPAMALLVWVLFSQMVLGVWHVGWALMGVMLLLFAFQGLTIGTVVLVLKRAERRLVYRLEKNLKNA